MPILSHSLKEQILAGNMVLFLGAGASFGAKNPSGQMMPSGQQLADMLAEKFLGPDHKGLSLSYVADLCISELDLFKVQKFIADYFIQFEPLEYHKMIFDFRWKAIFTTNYDLLVERSFRLHPSHIQDLRPVIKNEPADHIFRHDKILPYYKLHGCINDIADPEAPLILTNDHFLNYRSKRSRLFDELHELSYDHPILFVGFGMADIDIIGIINSLDRNIETRTRSFMVGPKLTEMDMRMWDTKKKISGIKMTFEDFLKTLNSEITPTQKKLAAIRPAFDKPIFEKFALSVNEVVPSPSFLSFLENDVEFVHSSLNSPNTDPIQFYKGFTDNWDPIIKNLDVKRKILDGILYEVFLNNDRHSHNDQAFFLIKGNAGSGKSVFLKRLALEASNSDRFCILWQSQGSVTISNISELYKYAKDRIYLFVDDVSKFDVEIILLLSKAKKEGIPITIIGTERYNVWNTECDHLSSYLTEDYALKYLHTDEIRELIVLLEKFNALGSLKFKSFDERVAALNEKAGRELLVALYEATNSRPFELIIQDEYNRINHPKAQSFYLTVSIFHRMGAEARAGFISRVHNIAFSEFKDKLFMPLEYIVFDKYNSKINDYVYVTRNKMIAEIVFEHVLTNAQDRFDEYLRVLQYLNIGYESDKMAFKSITNGRKLLDNFSDVKLIRKIYELAETVSPDDPKLYQQRAIFEMNAAGGNLNSAELHLKEALRISPSDNSVKHSKAELLLKRAERSKLQKDFIGSIDESIKLCNEIVSRVEDNSHAYHTILKAYIMKLQYVTEDLEDAPAIERIIKDIERAFAVSKQIHPTEPFILELEAKFQAIIKEKQAAKKLLEQAFSLNKSSPFIALRLANYYERENLFSEALAVVKECLDLNNGDKDLNYKYGNLLEKLPEPNFEEIMYYYRRSYTFGDTRYQAQLRYARSLYILNQLPESKAVFATLSKVRASHEEKSRVVAILKKEGRSIEFEGIIVNLELKYGFVKRNLMGDELFFYRFENDIEWDDLQNGLPIVFNIGFNYKGSVAINVQLKK